jgi:hypothetical protein
MPRRRYSPQQLDAILRALPVVRAVVDGHGLSEEEALQAAYRLIDDGMAEIDEIPQGDGTVFYDLRILPGRWACPDSWRC